MIHEEDEVNALEFRMASEMHQPGRKQRQQLPVRVRKLLKCNFEAKYGGTHLLSWPLRRLRKGGPAWTILRVRGHPMGSGCGVSIDCFFSDLLTLLSPQSLLVYAAEPIHLFPLGTPHPPTPSSSSSMWSLSFPPSLRTACPQPVHSFIQQCLQCVVGIHRGVRDAGSVLQDGRAYNAGFLLLYEATILAS